MVNTREIVQPCQEAFLADNFSLIAEDVFRDAPPVFRLMQRWRPYICPFELLVPEIPSGSTVLDIGCGAGLFLGLLAMLGRRIHGVGVDSSPQAIRCAQRMSHQVNQRELGSHLQFQILPSGQALPDGPFDVVTVIDVVHHVPRTDQERFLFSAIDRLAPGGRLVYKDMASGPWWRHAAARLHDLVIARQWIHEAPVSMVRPWAESRGLTCLYSGEANQYCYGHEFAIFEKPRTAEAETPRRLQTVAVAE